MFYGIYYYDTNGINSSPVYLAGFYQTLDEAKIKLNNYLPNYEKGYDNSIKTRNRVAWINEYYFGDIKGTSLICNQPHSSINLFNN